MIYHLQCTNCQIAYTTKYKPKNVHFQFCSHKCSNIYKPRKSLQGKCHMCDISCSSTRKYCSTCFKIYLSTKNKMSPALKKEKNNRWVKSFQQRTKLKAIEYKGGKCEICGYHKYAGALHFHHKNEKEKLFDISGKSISWERLRPELDKCLLLCANCHAEHHEDERINLHRENYDISTQSLKGFCSSSELTVQT